MNATKINPYRLVLEGLRAGDSFNQIEKRFYENYPSAPQKDFRPIHDNIVSSLYFEALKKEDKIRPPMRPLYFCLADLPNELHQAAKEKDIRIETNGERNLEGKPFFKLVRLMFSGWGKCYLYEGTEPSEAMEVIKRATVCSAEEKKEFKESLLSGYDIVPGYDGDFVLLGRRDEILTKGDMIVCLNEMKWNEISYPYFLPVKLTISLPCKPKRPTEELPIITTTKI